MSLKVRHIKEIMEGFAPVDLKENYDNVGLMVGDPKCAVTSILVALDCTLEVIDEAIDMGSNLIITHHPLLFLQPRSITADTLLGSKIIKLIENNINVYSSHTNLDIVKGGLNDIITQLLGYDKWEIIESADENSEDNRAGIGRLVALDKHCSLLELCNKIKTLLDIPHLRYSGEDNKIVKKVAIVNGSGEDYFKASLDKGADCIITGDTSYHFVSDYNEMGMCIIDAGHFETEWPAMKVIADMLQNKLNTLGYDNCIYISGKSKAPYKFI